jgi:hypothetical protein
VRHPRRQQQVLHACARARAGARGATTMIIIDDASRLVSLFFQ